MANSSKIFSSDLANKKLKEIGVDYLIDVYLNGAKATPTFSKMGADMFMKKGKLGNGKYKKITKIRKYSKSDIDDAISKIKSKKGVVKVNVTSNRDSDFINCWKELGVEPALGQHLLNKLELTWHHLDDLDTTVQSHFELVHREVHKQTIQHLGSFFQMEQLLKLIK